MSAANPSSEATSDLARRWSVMNAWRSAIFTALPHNVCRNRARTEGFDFSCRVNECSGSRLCYAATWAFSHLIVDDQTGDQCLYLGKLLAAKVWHVEPTKSRELSKLRYKLLWGGRQNLDSCNMISISSWVRSDRHAALLGSGSRKLVAYQQSSVFHFCEYCSFRIR